MSPHRDPQSASDQDRNARVRSPKGGLRVSGAVAKDAAALAPLEVARRFVEARRAARSLAGFPGAIPVDMAAGYQIQEAAIGLWPDEVDGWKVGRIPTELQ